MIKKKKKKIRTATASRRQRPLRCETLEPRHLLAANPIITEFMASNNTTIDDGFGSDNDWIEIQNAGDMAVDLQGYHLTDNAGNLSKWTFTTSTVLQPSEFLLVFASGLDTIDPAGYRHTGFKLSAGGEYLALTDSDETVLSEFGANGTDYPPQLTDTSFGHEGTALLTGETVVDYLPSPGASLGISWTGIGFDASANGFQSGPAAIGYETNTSGTVFTNHINSTVTDGTTSVYIRHEFEIADASAISGLNLNLKLDDGVVVYLNGQLVESVRAPASPAWNSTATSDINDVIVLEGADYSLSGSVGSLQNGTNVLAMHLLNVGSGSSDLLIVPTLTASGSGTPTGYLNTPTPGTVNSDLFPQGPLILDVDASPKVPVAGQPIVIEAEISPYLDPIDTSTVSMTYRRMWATEVTLAMRDDGLGADVTADDGVYTAQIPGGAIQAGEMIRWFVSVDDTAGLASRAPRFLDPLDSAEYFGAVTPDPTASTDVPVIDLFVQDTVAIETDSGTRASLQFRGTFYDNIHVDVHGQSTRGFPKKSIDVDSNTGEKFDIADGVGKASDFNLLTNYGDQTKLRHPLAYDVFREAGVSSSLAYTVSLHRNGQFYGLYDFVEEADEEQLRRFGFDENNNLYKVNNNLTSATNQVEQKAGSTTGDFQEVVNGNGLGNNHNTATHNWDWDNLDMADMVNYLAVQHFIQNSDFGHKNMYWYHDNSGTGLWSALPWDVDLSFGHKWNSTDTYFDNDLITTPELNSGWNNIFQRLRTNSEFKAMHDRRLRTLMDQFLGKPGTNISDSWLYKEMTARRSTLADEMTADAAAWPNTTLNPGFPSAYPFTPTQAVDQQLNTWLPTRRNVLEGIGSIPNGHGDSSNIRLGAIDFNPAGNNLSQQYLVIENNENFAVDISGWTIGGAITHTFKPGTIIAANDDLFLAADVQGFLTRTTGPQGGQQRFLQGGNSGTWNPGGGVLDLMNVSGDVIDSDTYGIIGDFNGDDNYNCADLGPLTSRAANGTYHAAYDMNADGAIDLDDVNEWRNQAGYVNLGAGQSYQYGDANLDGLIDEQDFAVWNTHRFTSGKNWCQGDFNTDGVTDVSDMNLWNQYKHSTAIAAATRAEIRVPRAAPPAVIVNDAVVNDAVVNNVIDAAFAGSSAVASDAADARQAQRSPSNAIVVADVEVVATDGNDADTSSPIGSLTAPVMATSATSRSISLTLANADEEETAEEPWWNDGPWNAFE